MKINNVKIEAIQGDISKQHDISAIVNAANAELQIGGGVAGAIHTAAGRGLAEESRQLAPIRPGQAVITGAYELPNDYVIHVLGPVYGFNKPEDQFLANCYKNALKIAEENKITSIAFPAISTGAFGFPFEEATDIAIDTIQENIHINSHLNLLRFVLFSESDLKIYKQKLQAIS